MENNSPVVDSDILQIDKYEPHKVANGKNDATFFVASDDIDLVELQRYRIQAQTEYLIAITTTNKDYDCLKLADNVILCSPNAAPLVMQAFQLLHSGSGIIGMSWDEVKWAISGNKNIEFLYGVAGGENCVAFACEQFISKLQRLSSNYPIKNVMINMFADISFGCEQQDFIIQQIDKNLEHEQELSIKQNEIQTSIDVKYKDIDKQNKEFENQEQQIIDSSKNVDSNIDYLNSKYE